MEDGDVESLAQGLPRDLAEFVLQNNNEFRDECIQWDKGLEERKRLEESQKELAQQQALAGNSGSSSTSTDPNNDVLVSSDYIFIVITYRDCKNATENQYMLIDLLCPLNFRLCKKS